MVYFFSQFLVVDDHLIEPIKLRKSAKDLFNFLRDNKDIQLDLQSHAVHAFLRNNTPERGDSQELIYCLNECELFSSYLGDDCFASTGRRLYASFLVDGIISECRREDFGYVLDRGALSKLQSFILGLIARSEEFSQKAEGILTRDLLDDTLLFLLNKVWRLLLLLLTLDYRHDDE